MDEADFTILEMVAACGGQMTLDLARLPMLANRVRNLTQSQNLTSANNGMGGVVVELSDLGRSNLQMRRAA